MGMITDIDKGKMIFFGTKAREKMNSSALSKGPVHVSGFLQNLFGGSGAFNPSGSFAGGAFNPFSGGAVGGGQTNAGFGEVDSSGWLKKCGRPSASDSKW